MIVTARMPVLGLAKGARVDVDEIRVTEKFDSTKIIGKVVAARVTHDGVLELDLEVEDVGLYRVIGDISIEEESSKPDA